IVVQRDLGGVPLSIAQLTLLGNAAINACANPPLPGIAGADGVTDGTPQLYDVLTGWVEKGVAPRRIDIFSAVTTTFPVAKSRPICFAPDSARHVDGRRRVGVFWWGGGNRIPLVKPCISSRPDHAGRSIAPRVAPALEIL